jgi:hypothetical protein
MLRCPYLPLCLLGGLREDKATELCVLIRNKAQLSHTRFRKQDRKAGIAMDIKTAFTVKYIQNGN